jgi:hypothetical protein
MRQENTMTDDETDVDQKDYKYDASDESEEEIKAQLEEWREEYPSAELVDDGGAKITNDEDTIAEAQRRGEFSNPDEHKEEIDDSEDDE